ncbi:sugar transferase [Nocardioides solisilvae]|uniref:sugar transferase n=1 Tax=Nocardioides solisilvae TaxID=1542435 RepID=UPI0013A591E3|nr:sugar transferase [Nocardioides solisilvae]
MKSQSQLIRAIPYLVLLVDALLISLVLVSAAVFRDHVTWGIDSNITNEVTWLAPLIAMGWLGGIAFLGGYRPEVFDTGLDEYKRVSRGTLMAAAVVGIGCYLFKYDLSRGFFVLAFGCGVVVLLLGRFLLRHVAYALRKRGHLHHKVVIAGSRSHADELALNLTREKRLGYRVIGAVTPAYDMNETTRSGITVFGDIEDLAQIAIESGSDVVFIAGGAFGTATQLKELAWALENHDIQLVVAPSLTDVSGERIRFRPVAGLPLIHVDGPRGHLATRSGKRAFDFFGSLMLILALSPVLLFAALRVKLHDGGPVFFSQTRIGKDGVPFQCLKFRTMVVDAEALVAKLQEEQGAQALLFKMKDDPRITKPGKWLRRFSVDEVPQLFNVLRGDMSLIGPRPQVQREVDLYEGGMIRRLRVRPGMTGLWQVSGRSDLTAQEAMRLDLYYVDNWSMVQDLSILARTVKAVFGSDGAY